jgi:uncharacterized alkaline shock family protein YloU
MTHGDKTDFGTIKIHDNVIASIAYLAALEVEGVARVCDDIKSSVRQLFGKKTKSGAIDVTSESADGVMIAIPIVVKYGHNIPEVAVRVQEKVKTAVEESTDLVLKDIAIKIKGVEK